MAQTLQQWLFLVMAAAAVAAAFGVIFNRNAVYSALSLLVNFASLAVLYLMLNAQFIAVVQVIVYAGAIVVLFLFVVMLLGAGGKTQIGSTWLSWRMAFVVGAGLVLLTLIGTVVFEWPIGGATGLATPSRVTEVGQTEAVGIALFTKYLLPFELASILLLVGMIGAVVLGQRWRGTLRRSDQGDR